MSHLILPKNYDPLIDLMESQRAIKKIKDYFQQELAYGLNLRRVSAPLFVDPKTGLNDNLNGVERRVSFTLKDIDELEVEVVQSLEEDGSGKIQNTAGTRHIYRYERHKKR